MEKGDTLPFCTMRLKVSVMPSIVWWWFERRDAQDQTSEIRVLRDRDNPYLIFTPCGADPSKVRVWSSLNNWIFFFFVYCGHCGQYLDSNDVQQTDTLYRNHSTSKTRHRITRQGNNATSHLDHGPLKPEAEIKSREVQERRGRNKVQGLGPVPRSPILCEAVRLKLEGCWLSSRHFCLV